MPVEPYILQLFPGLSPTDANKTSESTRQYNCIAWAADDRTRQWWPLPPNHFAVYWPRRVPNAVSCQAFELAFNTLGYRRCQDESLEVDIEKVAIFVDANNVPTHAARQLPDGYWTSKLGDLEDIRHALRQLEGSAYGTVAFIMSRPRARNGQ